MRTSKIPWTQRGWDITRGCRHDCRDLDGKQYCYTRRYLKDPLNPQIFPDKLNEPLNLKPSMIFVSSSGDLMGNWIPDDFLIKAFEIMNKCPQHIFQILTKNPERYLKIPAHLFQPWIWLGTSVTRNTEMGRANILKEVVTPGPRFISFEPLFDYISDCDFTWLRWAIIGARTTYNSEIGVNINQTQVCASALMSYLRRDKVPIFIKPNLNWSYLIKEMPEYYYKWKVKLMTPEKTQGEFNL